MDKLFRVLKILFRVVAVAWIGGTIILIGGGLIIQTLAKLILRFVNPNCLTNTSLSCYQIWFGNDEGVNMIWMFLTVILTIILIKKWKVYKI